MENVTLSLNKVTSTPFTGEEINNAARVTFAVIGAAMGICAVLGNCLLITVIIRRFRRKRCVHNLFIVNLAVADMLIMGYWWSFFVLDLILGYHPVVNQAHCVVNGVITAVLCMVTVCSLMSISLNRYLHVCHSHLYARLFTFPRTILFCSLSWLLGFLLSLPPLFGHYHDGGVGVGGHGDGGEVAVQGSYAYNSRGRICSYSRQGVTYPKVLVVFFATVPMFTIGYWNFAIFRFWRSARMNVSCRYPALARTGDTMTSPQDGRGIVARWTSNLRRWAGGKHTPTSPSQAAVNGWRSEQSPTSTWDVPEASDDCLDDVEVSECPREDSSFASSDPGNNVAAREKVGEREVCGETVSQNGLGKKSVNASWTFNPFKALRKSGRHTAGVPPPAGGGWNGRGPKRSPEIPTVVIEEDPTPSASAEPSTLPAAGSLSPARALPRSPKFKQRNGRPSARRSKNKQASTVAQNLRKRRREQKAREVAFVRSLFVVWALMFFSFIPYGLGIIVSSYVSVPTEVDITLIMLLFSNNAVNWIVYGAMNPTFRRGYVRNLRRVLVAFAYCLGRRLGGQGAEGALNASKSSLTASMNQLNTENDMDQSCVSQSPSTAM